MKRFKYAALLTFVALVAIVGISYGQAYNSAWTTSITYQNVGTGEATVMFDFYAENNGTPVSVTETLAAGAGASLFVGNVSQVGAGFTGSAVMSSNEPVVATLVQIASDSAVKNRPLSNGFSGGSDTVLLPTVLKNQFSTTSRFSIQNVSSGTVDVTINIYNAAAPNDPPIVVTHDNLPSGAAQYFDMGALSGITAASFNGSATVTAVDSTSGDPADIVGSVLELGTGGSNSAAASAFEGVSGGAGTIYMATGLCQAFGADSAYAVQNVGGAVADVTVTYTSGQTDTAMIDPGAKNSFIACDVLPTNTSTAATITADQDIVVIGKVFGSGNSTAWVGAEQGSNSIAMPYVRFTEANWANGTRQRAYIAIQNIGSALSAGDVVLEYRDLTGAVVGTHNLGAMATGQKLNSFATDSGVMGNAADLAEFGYIGGFGGSVILSAPAGAELVTVVRVQSSTGGSSVVGEDATGIPLN